MAATTATSSTPIRSNSAPSPTEASTPKKKQGPTAKAADTHVTEGPEVAKSTAAAASPLSLPAATAALRKTGADAHQATRLGRHTLQAMSLGGLAIGALMWSGPHAVLSLIPILGGPLVGIAAQSYLRHRANKSETGVKLNDAWKSFVAAHKDKDLQATYGKKLENLPADLKQAHQVHSFLQRNWKQDVKHDLYKPVAKLAKKLWKEITPKAHTAETTKTPAPGAAAEKLPAEASDAP